MTPFRHDLVSILYTIQGWSESHLAQVGEGKFQTLEGRVLHAEEALTKTLNQSFEALAIIRRLALKGGNSQTDDSLPLRESKSKHSSDVLAVWRRVLERLRDAVGLENVRIIERVPQAFPSLNCPPEELEEILFNLSVNSLQAMRESRVLILEARLRYNSGGERTACLSLTDTGSGISDEDLSRIFSPFFTTKPPGEGNGLGLYRVRQLVQRNSGKISAASFPGCGATFTVELPVCGEKGSEKRPAEEAA